MLQISEPNKFRELKELCSESRILYSQLVKKKGGMVELSNEQKQHLSTYIPDLVKKIYEKIKDLKYNNYFWESKIELEKLISLYTVIFIEQFRENEKYIRNILKKIPANTRTTYTNLLNKKTEITEKNRLFKEEENKYLLENPPNYSS